MAQQLFIDSILEEPVSQLRLELLIHAKSKHLDKLELDRFVRKLEVLDREHIPEAIDMASRGGRGLSVVPDIQTDALQLFWAAQILHWQLDYLRSGGDFNPIAPKPNPVHLPVWNNLRNHILLENELFRYAGVLKDHFNQARTHIRWGHPFSWFSYQPEADIVNIDLFFSLVFGLPNQIGGLSHSRGPGFHEIGHAVLSKELPEPFRRPYERVKELEKKTTALTDAEQREITDCSIDCMLWGQFFNMAEDNAVNRFATLLGRGEAADVQDYTHSLKYFYALISHSFGHFEQMSDSPWSKYVNEVNKFLEKLRGRTASDQFKAIITVIGLSVLVHDGLMPNTKEGWQSVGLDWNAFLPGRSDKEKYLAINDIIARCDQGSASLSHQQPLAQLTQENPDPVLGLREFRRAGTWLARLTGVDDPQTKRILMFNRRRNKVMEELWNDYVVPIYPQLKKEAEQQAKENQSRASKAGQSQQGNGSGVPSPSDLRSPAGQKPQESKAKRNPQSGQKSDDEGNSKHGTSSNNDGEDTGREEAKDSDPKGNDHKGKDRVGESDEIDKNGVKREDTSDDEVPEFLPQPENEDQGKTIKELIDEAARRGQQKADREADAERGMQAKVTRLQTIDYDFPEGDWSNYLLSRQKLAWLIKAVKRSLGNLRRKQVQTTEALDFRLEAVPEDGDFDRFSMEAHLELAIKSVTDQVIEQDDLRRFHTDRIITTQTTPEIVLLVDGSISMMRRADGKSGPSPIDIAISTAVAFYEGNELLTREMSGKNPAFLYYAGIWGPANPSWLVLPGMARDVAGKNFDRFRNGLQTNTHFAPAGYMVAEKLKESPAGQPAHLGAVHLVIVSDGDIQDFSATTKVLGELVKTVKNITVDVLMLNSRSTQMEETLKAIARENPNFKYGIVRGFNIERLPLECIKLLEKRLGRGVVAVPAKVRRSQFSKVYENLQRLIM